MQREEAEGTEWLQAKHVAELAGVNCCRGEQLWVYLLAAMFGQHKVFDELLNRYRDALGMQSVTRLLLVKGLISAGL